MLLRRIALVVGAASALTLLLANSSPPAAAQGADGAAALAGQVASTEEGPMEGVIVSAKKDGSNYHRQRHHQRAGPLQLPGGAARARPLQPANSRGRIRPRRSQKCRCRGGAARQRRPQAAQDPQPEQAAHQCRMDDEHPRHRRRQAPAHQLRELPHPRAGGEIEPRRRRVRAGDRPHERLCPGQPADQAATAGGPVARRQSGTLPQGGRVSRHHQSELRA